MGSERARTLLLQRQKIDAPTFAASSPRPLLEGRPATRVALVTTPYDVAPDGQQFIMAKETGPESGSTQVHVVLDWVEELKRQVAAGKN
ncbi:MAG: hypothetical protein ACRD2Y_06295 [Terriglobales bacterium]